MTIKVGINGFGRIGRCTLSHIAASGREKDLKLAARLSSLRKRQHLPYVPWLAYQRNACEPPCRHHSRQFSSGVALAGSGRAVLQHLAQDRFVSTDSVARIGLGLAGLEQFYELRQPLALAL